jgi:hypothetical protein
MRHVLIAFFLLALSGCASMNQRCSYFPDGTLESYRLRSTVLGTGETEVITTDCAALAYSTKDTGLSDNGKEALGKIAEGAVRALVPMP